jgi:phytoene dehydrogenase-like protein
LDLKDLVKPVFLNPYSANIFHFSSSGVRVDFPYGVERLRDSLSLQFPEEKQAVRKYFDDIDRISANTPALDLNSIFAPPVAVPEESVTLAEYLNGLTSNRILRETLSALIMCHGSAPSEISMADNSRLCRGFYESVAMLEGGGSSLVDALLNRLKKYDVTISCDTEITSLEDIQEKSVGKFVLSSGDSVSADACVFTINPKSILDLLPRTAFPPAFFKRVENFDCTPGFFTLFATLDNAIEPIDVDSITSEYPIDDINALSLPGWNAPGALAIMHSRSANTNIVTAFEPIYWEQVSKWSSSTVGARPTEYYEWKSLKERDTIDRISNIFPSYRGHLNILTSATPLTYRDYLNHYNGAAYGMKSKRGQYNLVGQLRLRNLFVAGQSAILPGVLGTMMASVIVSRTFLGENTVCEILNLQMPSSDKR